jgi:hypothetical protein
MTKCDYVTCDREACKEFRDGSMWCEEHYIEMVRVAAEAVGGRRPA